MEPVNRTAPDICDAETGAVVIRNIGFLLTMRPDTNDLLDAIPNAAMVTRGSRIVYAGPEKDLPADLRHGGIYTEIDAQRALVTPGLIDSHTHVVFAGERADEFQARHAGADYEEIQRLNGGIHRTVRETRAAPYQSLRGAALERLQSMRRHGTTTVEGKTGYGLEFVAEEKILNVMRALSGEPHLPDIIPTFLGAHIIPVEFGGHRSAYVQHVIQNMAPAFIGQARFCDVYCEESAFSVLETKTILEAARALGYLLKMHTNQSHDIGGAALAADLGVVSADHLDHIQDADIQKLANAGVIATLLPGCSFSMQTSFPNARRFLERGATVALATDYNPGTCNCENLQMIMALAVAHCGLTVEQSLQAVTLNAAKALALTDRGCIAANKRADALIWKIRDYREIGYHFGVNLVDRVIVSGAVW